MGRLRILIMGMLEIWGASALAQTSSPPFSRAELIGEAQRTLYGQGQGYLDGNAMQRLQIDILNSSAALANFAIDPTASPCNAKGDGVTDDTAALQCGVNLARIEGGSLSIPALNFVVRGNLVLSSGSVVKCAPGAVLWEQWQETIFINSNAQRNWLTDYTAANRTTATDHDITVQGCTGNFTQAGTKSGPWMLGSGMGAFLLAQRVHFDNNFVYGDVTGVFSQEIPNVIRLQKVFDSDANGNFGSGIYNLVGIWGGSQNVVATFNTGFLAPNLTSANAYSCSNINGVGAAPNDHQTTSEITYSDNYCAPAGGANGTGGMVAYNNAAGSSGSVLNDLIFDRNRTYATGSKNFCFSATGALDGWTMRGNVFSGCDAGAVVLTAKALSWGTPTTPFTTTSGSPLVLTTIAGVTTGNVSVGNWISIAGSVSVGGLTLTGTYPIVAVDPTGGDFTFNAGANASSSANGGANAINTYQGNPRNFVVEGNHLYNTNALNSTYSNNTGGEFWLQGPNNVLKNNTVSGGSYGSLALVSDFDCCSATTPVPTVVGGNVGTLGSGVPPLTAGWAIAGDAFVAFQAGYGPQIQDYAPEPLGQCHLPMILPSSGTMGNNGALSAITALPFTYPAAYIYMPAGAIASGSTAGFYYFVGSSTTAGTIYNNTYTGGNCSIPASPTLFATTGPGAYTQTTSTNITGPSFQIQGGRLGINGSVEVKGLITYSNSANSKFFKLGYGGTISQMTLTTNSMTAFATGFSNRGSTGVQIPLANSSTSQPSQGTGSPFVGGTDSTQTQSLLGILELSAATDFIVLENYKVDLYPAN